MAVGLWWRVVSLPIIHHFIFTPSSYFYIPHQYHVYIRCENWHFYIRCENWHLEILLHCCFYWANHYKEHVLYKVTIRVNNGLLGYENKRKAIALFRNKWRCGVYLNETATLCTIFRCEYWNRWNTNSNSFQSSRACNFSDML